MPATDFVAKNDCMVAFTKSHRPPRWGGSLVKEGVGLMATVEEESDKFIEVDHNFSIRSFNFFPACCDEAKHPFTP